MGQAILVRGYVIFKYTDARLEAYTEAKRYGFTAENGVAAENDSIRKENGFWLLT
jgi:hypothetical protein